MPRVLYDRDCYRIFETKGDDVTRHVAFVQGYHNAERELNRYMDALGGDDGKRGIGYGMEKSPRNNCKAPPHVIVPPRRRTDLRKLN